MCKDGIHPFGTIEFVLLGIYILLHDRGSWQGRKTEVANMAEQMRMDIARKRDLLLSTVQETEKLAVIKTK
jgi:hypothetical protein